MKRRVAKKIIKNFHLNYKESSFDKAYAVLHGHDGASFRRRLKELAGILVRFRMKSNMEIAS